MSRPQKRWILVASLAVVAVLAGAADSHAGAASRAARVGKQFVVDMKGFAYRPGALVVSAGDTVLWSNHDDEPHSVSMDTTEFDSGDIAPGSKFRWVFRQKGRYRYHCEVHPRMKGTLTVK